MSTKKQTSTKSKKIAPAKPANKEQPAFSYEFLDMLIDTGFVTLADHLKKIGAVDEAELLDHTYCLVLEQLRIVEGRKATSFDDSSDSAMKVVHYASKFGAEWFSPTGRVTPLKELLAMRAADNKKG